MRTSSDGGGASTNENREVSLPYDDGRRLIIPPATKPWYSSVQSFTSRFGLDLAVISVSSPLGKEQHSGKARVAFTFRYESGSAAPHLRP
jgi:hypothetical protein